MALYDNVDLFSFGRFEQENVFIYPKIDILKRLNKRTYRLNAYADISLKQVHRKLKLIDVKRLIVYYILTDQLQHWKQTFEDGDIIQYWYLNGDLGKFPFFLLVKHKFIPDNDWKIKDYISLIKICERYLEPANNLIHTFLDQKYNSIPTNQVQDHYIQQRLLFEKERYQTYLVREEQKYQESIKNTLFKHLEVKPKKTSIISDKTKKKKKFFHQNRLQL